MMQMRFLCLCTLLSACAADQFKLPSNTLRYADVEQKTDGMDVELQPVTGATWLDHKDVAKTIRWHQRAAYARYELSDASVPRDYDLMVPIVPLPSIEVAITNDGDAPISFANASIVVTDDHQNRYPLATNVKDYLTEVLDPLVTESLELWLRRLHYGPVASWPEKLTRGVVQEPGLMAATAVRALAEKVPLFGRNVVVEPHTIWRGVLVVKSDVTSMEELADRLRGNLHVSWSGVSVGERVLPREVYSMSMAAKSDDPCMQRPDLTERTRRAYVDGTSITKSEALGTLVATPASMKDAKEARSMRIAGSVLVGAGIAAAGATVGVLAGTGRTEVAPAGLAMLGVSAVGGVLNYVAYKKEKAATREYNEFADTTGACAAPK